MDSHSIARGRESLQQALQQIRSKTMVIGITTDILFPLSEQIFIASNISNAHFIEIDSLYGHDGFLLEFEQIENIIGNFMREKNDQ
jgi:homoserine O-acetyltransferase